MALFKVLKGNRSALSAQALHDGYAYFCVDDGSFHIDYADSDGVLKRKQISSEFADKLKYNNGISEIELNPAELLTVSNYEAKIGTATESKSGLMSSSDKAKVDALDTTYATIDYVDELVGDIETALAAI